MPSVKWCPSLTHQEALGNGMDIPGDANRRVVDVPQIIHRYIKYLIRDMDAGYSMTHFTDSAIRYGMNTLKQFDAWRVDEFVGIRQEIMRAKFSYELPEVGHLYEMDLDHEPVMDAQLAFHQDHRIAEFLPDYTDYCGFDSQWPAIRHLVYHALYFHNWAKVVPEDSETRPLQICQEGVFKMQQAMAS